ncbi:AMP-binding protein [Microbacterium sp. No. 7]|uniref:AMP-binding protein n=1 Tax=Microbacterium sp. No. 7 TaxID=1714373 RepID=UPI0006D2149C|nr:AMP-binding protein [Microbacterium sp. No. 7]
MVDRDQLFPQVVARWAREAPERVFLQHADTGESWTYARTNQEGLVWADVFDGRAPDSVVVTFLPNSLDYVAVALGLAWVPTIEVPANTNLKGDLLAHVIRDSGATEMVVGEELLERASSAGEVFAALERVIVVPRAGAREVLADPSVLPANGVGSREVLASAVARERSDEEGPGPYDLAFILYTSGTTGPSKGVMCTWTQTMGPVVAGRAHVGPDDADYVPLPLFHIGGRAKPYRMAFVGGRCVVKHSFKTRDFWSDVRAYACTVTQLMPQMARWLLAQEPRDDDADNPLDIVMMVPLIDELPEFRERFGVRIRTGYNMTETSGPIGRSDDVLTNEGHSGSCRPGFQLRIADDDDRPVPVGEVGELLIRADEPGALMAGYWRNPEKTVEAWRNLWFHTGDLFRVDEQGRYYYVDRKKDSIRRRGENISSAEVEQQILTHPDVLEAGVVATPSPEGEDEVLAFVLPHAGSDLTAGALHAHLMEVMPRFMVPRFIELVDDFPRTEATLRIQKAELRKKGRGDATWDALADETSRR